jgi:hypothetical protein
MVQVLPALKVSPRGDLVEAASGRVAKLHGNNWFGWETDSPSVDGLWVSSSSKSSSSPCAQRLRSHSVTHPATAALLAISGTSCTCTLPAGDSALPVEMHPRFQSQPGNWCCCCCTRTADDATGFKSLLQAYDDADLPPTSAVSNASIALLGVGFWGKRTMTNDFATVVHRMKALGGEQQ